MSTFATIYYGNGEVEKVHAPRPLRRMLHRLRCLSKSLARKSKGSHNWYKAKRRIARLHYRIGCIRQDFLQKLTHRLAALAKESEKAAKKLNSRAKRGSLKVETLNIAGWMKMWGRVVGDLAPHELYGSCRISWSGEVVSWRRRIVIILRPSCVHGARKRRTSPHEQGEWVDATAR